MLLAIALLAALALGNAAAAFAAAIVPESILISGPVIGVVGVTLAVLSYRAGLAVSFLYAMLGPTTFVGCAGLIAAMKWGPHEARWTIALILALSATTHLALAWRAIQAWRCSPGHAKLPVQFGLRWMFLIILLAVLPMATFRLAGDYASVLAAVLSYAICLIAVVWSYQRTSRQQRVE